MYNQKFIVAITVSAMLLTACGADSTQDAANEALAQAEVAAPAPAEEIRPSFDCSKARLTSEILVCQDSQLARLDRDLAAAFSAAEARMPNSAQLTASQENWWVNTLSQCADRDCLYQAYTDRIQALAGSQAQFSDAATLRQKADKWQGCSILSATIAAIAVSENNNRVTRDRMQAAVIYNNIAIYLLVLSGQNVQSARAALRNKKYAESTYLEEANRNNGIITNLDNLESDEAACTADFRNIQNSDADTLYVVTNYDIAKGTEQFQ